MTENEVDQVNFLLLVFPVAYYYDQGEHNAHAHGYMHSPAHALVCAQMLTH